MIFRSDAGASIEAETPVVSGEVWGFEPDLLVDVLPSGGLAFSDSSAYAVKITDPSGARLRTLRRPVSPRPATEAMRRAARERRLEAITVSRSGAPSPEADALLQGFVEARTAAIENMRFFAEVPVISTVRATWNGGLWVQRSGEPDPSEPGPIDVLAPDGRYVGSLDPGGAGHAGRLRSGRPRRLRRDRRSRRSGHHRQATSDRDPLNTSPRPPQLTGRSLFFSTNNPSCMLVTITVPLSKYG